MRVLVVEDEPTLCEVYEDFLSERGHETVVAQTAEEALDALQSARPDAVILDIHLPGMSGLDLLRLRITQELGVPVIVISGIVSEQQARECLALGARRFMGKPVSFEHLGRELEALLDDSTGAGPGERRTDRRVPVTLPVRVVSADGTSWSGNSVDLSVSGIRVRVPGATEAADATTVRLTLSEPVYLELPSMSVRVAPEEQAYRFVGLTDAQRTRLASIVEPGHLPDDATTGVTTHLRILHAIAETSGAAGDPDRVLAVALEALTHVTGHEISSLHRLDDDGRTLVLRGERGLPPALRGLIERLPLGDRVIGRVAATGETRNVPDAGEESDHFRAAGIAGFLSVAVKSRGRTFGVLSVGRRAHDVFTAAEVTVVEAAAGQIGLALENARLADEARERRDELQRVESRLTESARLSTIGQLAAGLAHDVAGPLTAILGHVELALRPGEDSEDTRRRLRIVLAEATRVTTLVESLLQVSRPRPPVRVACELAREVELVLSLMAAQLQRDGIHVAIELDDIPAAWADPAQARQVALNLVQNAAQALAAHAGDRRLTVRLRSQGDRARLEVIDSGPGIPPDALPRIFDAFFTTKPPGEGTGLGLWVSANLVAAHDGRIWAEPAPGGGAAFVVELPFAARRAPLS